MRAILFLLLLSSCTFGPHFRRPCLESPVEFENATCAQMEQEPYILWWEIFDDPLLNNLIACAVDQNFDVAIAEKKILQARGELLATRSVLYPTLITAFNAARYVVSNSFPLLTLATQFNSFNLGFDAFWELDLFGSLRKTAEASKWSMESKIEKKRHVTVTLIAELARAYIELRNFQGQLNASKKKQQLKTNLVELMELKRSQNLANTTEIAGLKQDVLVTKTEISSLEEAISKTMNQIEMMLGQLPGSIHEQLAAPAPVPSVPSIPEVGLPSELLCRRPDVRFAEKKLAQAMASSGAAVANFFPKFDLLGTAGFVASAIRDLFADGSRNSMGTGITYWPLFDAGRSIGAYKTSKAQEAEALCEYAKIVLTSFHDVENALKAYNEEKKRYTYYQEITEKNGVIVQNMSQLSTEGLLAKEEVYKKQLGQVEAEKNQKISQAHLIEDVIAIYKALGGGWEAFCD
ncbi:MAG: Outer membrane protein OprM [Chlamydiales bacterium]|nr:Outer membrane protein OprM [Chlamydiales bacterium]MCH9619842.1 Outer membrane protein OprM [Chlamydiales bacterium]MCH9622731.1 Outer membrane protein OprM [Chlamydiales bacterium]